MKKLSLVLMVLILSISTQAAFAGSGTEGDPYTIAEARALSQGATEYWAQGYIVGGRYDDFDTPWDNDYGISIADTDTESDVNNCLQLKLEADGGRDAWGLNTNPGNYQKLIKFKGYRDSYGGYPSFEGVNNEDIFEVTGGSNTSVQFTSSSATVAEGDGTYNLTVSITDPDGSNATNADVVLTSGEATDINNYTTQSVTFPAGSSDDQTVTLTITDDGDDEGNETLTFELQNVTGGNSASAGSPSSFDLTITDNDGTTITNPSSGQLIITEVDTEYSRGVFVELYNNTSSTIDLTGVTLAHYNGSTPANVTINLSGTLAAGAYYIIARNQTNFESTYGFSADLYESNMFLNDGNEWLILDNGARATIDQFGDNGVTWTADSVFERTSYPNSGGDMTNDWSDKGNVLGTPGSTNDVPLPVDLGDFRAEVEADGIRLLWTTESEIHNKGFYVYRSKDNIAYKKISGLIPGSGTTSETNTYSFVDKSVKYGQVYYYKISDVEENTLKETYHGPLAVIAGKGETNPEAPELPKSFKLSQNMPNPFNPNTIITYELPTKTYVSLKIYDANGRLVKILMDRELDAGYYSVNWDGTDNTGKTVNSGVYIYRLETDKEVESKSMILMK